ncbi:hypothetical protein [Gillisia hiemivivida]|nr:hypothetical protein [Gillisia hiemivivida]
MKTNPESYRILDKTTMILPASKHHYINKSGLQEDLESLKQLFEHH